MEQRSESWFLERCGFVTGSRLNDVMAKIKAGEAASRKNYKLQLAIERITKKPADSMYVNDAMQRGIDFEDTAVNCFEAKTGILTDKCGFVKSSDVAWLGASPDRLIDSDAILECKVPNTLTHSDYIIDGILPKKYVAQVQAQMLVTNRQRGYFISWDDRFIEGLELFVVEVKRDDEYLDNLVKEVNQFNKEVDELMQQLLEKRESLGVK